MPPDFALVLCAETLPIIDKDAPKKAVFVIDPDQTLRVATGPGCTMQTYPGPTSRLSTTRMQEVYNALSALDAARESASGLPHRDRPLLTLKAVARQQTRQFTIYNLTPGTHTDDAIKDPVFVHSAELLMLLTESSGLADRHDFSPPFGDITTESIRRLISDEAE